MDFRSQNMANKFWGVVSESLLTPFQDIKRDILNIFDLFSDVKLAFNMYQFSRKDMDHNGGTFKYDYHICCVWICLCIFAPVVIQYSTFNNRLYN